MTWSPQKRRLHALAFFCAAVPFAFALIRAGQTGGRDLRYGWVALASLLGGAMAMTVGKAHSRALKVMIALSAGAFVTATLVAVLAAVLLGTRLGPGILVVAAGFGFCSTASGVFHALARHRVP